MKTRLRIKIALSILTAAVLTITTVGDAYATIVIHCNEKGDGIIVTIQGFRPNQIVPVMANGAAAGNDPQRADTIRDFAYQAMEHLAFDTLDATINSLPDGRVGVLFHVIGKHDPPTRQVIRLSWLDVLRRRFLDRKLPLPSGTGVNLTLDTTLNLDELLADYADYRSLHSSPTVQP